MKLNNNDKIEIYHLRQLGWTWSQLKQRFDVNQAHLKYLVRKRIKTKLKGLSPVPYRTKSFQ